MCIRDSPWAKGFVHWPDDAPRIPHASPLLSKPRYPHMDYARAKGISKKYASSGWAAFERPFACLLYTSRCV